MKTSTIMVVALLMAAPITAQDIDIQYDEAAMFANYKTFAIQNGQVFSKAPALNNELARKKIENELRRALTAKRLTEVTGQADLNVFYALGAQRKMEVDRYPAGWRGLRTRVVRTQASEGTLTIDLRDTSTRELVWRAIAIEREDNPAKVADRLDEMVKKSIDRYPPKK